jgi:very-short-patch-repair endonuclease
MTKAEQIVYDLLRSKYLASEIQVNYRPEWLKNPSTGHNLELDFYIASEKVAYEVQGTSHTLLPDQQKRDEVKRELCKVAGVRLIEVPATRQGLKRLQKHFGVNYKIRYRETKYLYGEYGKRAMSASHYFTDLVKKKKKEEFLKWYTRGREAQQKETESVKRRREAKQS